jgi:tRNA dimethylallyltransferase
MRRPLVICIIGPTAVGKTAWGIEFAAALGAEVLNADSRQFYKGISIGTAQPSATEQQLAPHHFVGHLSLETLYSAGDFERDAVAWILERPVSVVVGGSGLYMQALLHGLDNIPRDLAVRDALNQELEASGLEQLAKELVAVDPEAAGFIDMANPQRVIRALEVFRSTGKPFSAFHSDQPKPRPFEALVIGMERPREELYSRINSRVHEMVAAGFEEEARSVWSKKDLNSLQTVGYREWFLHFEGKMDRSTTLEQIATRTRQFAKRQLTWFKRMDNVEWFSPQELAAAIQRAQDWVQESRDA